MQLMELYNALYNHFGKQNWWPVSDGAMVKAEYRQRERLSTGQKFEICIGAILTQNTAWQNVEKAIANLKKAKMLNAKSIAEANRKKLASLIKPSGYYNQKAIKLQLFCRYLQKEYNGKLTKMFSKPLDELREELLSLHGIGPETADSIILYAAQKPIFVIDAYTKRILRRVFPKAEDSYVEVQDYFMESLRHDAGLFSEFHALLVEFGKNYCRKKPLCGECFLKGKCDYYLRQQ